MSELLVDAKQLDCYTLVGIQDRQMVVVDIDPYILAAAAAAAHIHDYSHWEG